MVRLTQRFSTVHRGGSQKLPMDSLRQMRFVALLLFPSKMPLVGGQIHSR